MSADLPLDLSSVADDEAQINTSSTMDELMTVLDALEGHADGSIQASQDTEMYWATRLNERDELILSNRKSINDLQHLNDKLRDENGLLKQQLMQLDQSEIITALQGDAGESRKLSLQVNLK